MKRFNLIFAIVLIATTLSAQNKWSIYGGFNISKTGNQYGTCLTDITPNESAINWGSYEYTSGLTPGGYLGVAYDIDLKHGLSVQPGLEYSSINKARNLSASAVGDFKDVYEDYSWHAHTLSIPVLLNFRVKLNSNLGLRLGFGPYGQAIIAGWGQRVRTPSHHKIKDAVSTKDLFLLGGKAEFAVETGKHFSYTISGQMPFTNSALERTFTINAGVRYTF